MRFGIISDTHSRLPDKVFSLFLGVDLIFHAGDIGSVEILNDLKEIAPVKAVYGNVDTFPLVSDLTPKLYHKTEFFNICLTHIIGSPKFFAFELLKNKRDVNMVISGHTHNPEYVKFNNIHFINPGSVCFPRQSSKGSVAIVDVSSIEPIVNFHYLK